MHGFANLNHCQVQMRKFIFRESYFSVLTSFTVTLMAKPLIFDYSKVADLFTVLSEFSLVFVGKL